MNERPAHWREIAEGNSDHAMFGIVLLVGLSVAVAVGSTLINGLKFANAAAFFVPFGAVLGVLMLINLYQAVRMPGNKRFIFFVDMTIVKLTMSVAMMISQYSLACFKAYPITYLVQGFDRLLGFNWVKFSVLVNSVPHLSDFVGFCYVNWISEFIVVFILLSALSKYDELYNLTYSYIIAGMGSLLVTAFIDGESYDALASYAISGMHYPLGITQEAIDKVAHLRAGIDRVMDFDRIRGLVCFPSFHAGAAVLLATATRNLKWLWFPFLCFNIVVLVGTITEGGHNLADVVGGSLFAIGGIALAQVLRRSDIVSRLFQVASRALPSSAVSGVETARSA